MIAREKQWCAQCRVKTWHRYVVECNIYKQHGPWLESVTVTCLDCGRSARWGSMGVGQWVKK